MATALTVPQAAVNPKGAMTVYDRITDPIQFMEKMKDPLSALTGCNPNQGAAIAITLLSEGLTPIEFQRRYHWIPNRGPSMRSDAMLAEFRMNHDGDYEIKESTPLRAAITFIDSNDRRYDRELTARDILLSRWPWAKEPGWRKATSKAASLLRDGKSESEALHEMLPFCGDNWGTPTDWQNMLWSRLISSSLRLICPELVSGVYTPEEMPAPEAATERSSNAISTEEFLGVPAEAKPSSGATNESPAADEPVDVSFNVVDGQLVDTPDQPEANQLQGLHKSVFELASELFGDAVELKLQEAAAKRGVPDFASIPASELESMRARLESQLKK
ncbi:MAG: hypothetical protein AAGB04_00400 [Pseudomonadota bacterium]